MVRIYSFYCMYTKSKRGYLFWNRKPPFKRIQDGNYLEIRQLISWNSKHWKYYQIINFLLFVIFIIECPFSSKNKLVFGFGELWTFLINSRTNCWENRTIFEPFNWFITRYNEYSINPLFQDPRRVWLYPCTFVLCIGNLHYRRHRPR